MTFHLYTFVFIQEIRSRHWMKVMRLTGSSFQLEANVFQLAHVLDIELIKYDINPTSNPPFVKSCE